MGRAGGRKGMAESDIIILEFQKKVFKKIDFQM